MIYTIRGFLGVENLFDKVLQTISEWTPKAEHSTESKYRDDLILCLQESLNSEISNSAQQFGVLNIQDTIASKEKLD